MGIIIPTKASKEPLLVLWDTSRSARQIVFELNIDDVPKRFTDYASMQGGIGLHRADPNQRIIGVVCQGFRGEEYLVVISVADLRACSLTQSAKIPWGEWRRFATIVRSPGLMDTCISGSRFFAFGPTLLRIHDFSPGARGRRHPNRPAVQDFIMNVGHVADQSNPVGGALSEDNSLMFYVSAGYRIYGLLVQRSDAL